MICMKKNYVVTVGTRGRITVPFDCWMDAMCKNLTLEHKINSLPAFTNTWKGGKGMQKNMSYRVAVSYYPIGSKLTLIPDMKNKKICVVA